MGKQSFWVKEASAAIEGGNANQLRRAIGKHAPSPREAQASALEAVEAFELECLEACLVVCRTKASLLPEIAERAIRIAWRDGALAVARAGLDPNAPAINAAKRGDEPRRVPLFHWECAAAWRREEARGGAKAAKEPPKSGSRCIEELLMLGAKFTPESLAGALRSAAQISDQDECMAILDLVAGQIEPGSRAQLSDPSGAGTGGREPQSTALGAWLFFCGQKRVPWGRARAGAERLAKAKALGKTPWAERDVHTEESAADRLWAAAGALGDRDFLREGLSDEDVKNRARVLLDWLVRKTGWPEPAADGRTVLHFAMARMDYPSMRQVESTPTHLALAAMEVCPFEWVEPHLLAMKARQHVDCEKMEPIARLRRAVWEREQLAAEASAANPGASAARKAIRM
jgi:hypothetical protein